MSINFDQKFNQIKKVLFNEGIQDFSGFDVTFIEFFITSILDDSLSKSELFDMLQALCSETADFTENKKVIVLECIIQSVKNDPLLLVEENNSIENTKPATSKHSSSNINEVNPPSCTSKVENKASLSLDATSQLAGFEVAVLTTQLKSIFKDSNIRMTNSFDAESIMTLIGLVKETDNRELIIDIVCQFFPSTIGNIYVQEQIIKTLKSSKVISSSSSSSNNKSSSSTTTTGKVSSSRKETEEVASNELDDFSTDSIEDTTVMENLKNQVPHIDDDIIRYVYKIISAYNFKVALKVLSTNDISELASLTSEYKMKLVEEKKEQNRENTRIKALVTKNYSETQDLPSIDEKGKLIKRPAVIFMSTVGGGNQKIRYRDGMVVTNRGEKVIVEKNPFDDYDGGSRGKVKTKGKRGPGWV